MVGSVNSVYVDARECSNCELSHQLKVALSMSHDFPVIQIESEYFARRRTLMCAQFASLSGDDGFINSN